MSDQKENGENVTKYGDSKLHLSNPRKNISQASSASSSSSYKTNSVITGKNSRQTRNSEISSEVYETEEDLIEKIKNERKEIKKQKNFIKLPTTHQVPNPGVKENVGDDLSKKKELHILCECEPNATGAAVPTVTSLFVITPRKTQDAIVNDTASTASNRQDKMLVLSKNKNVLEKTTSTQYNEIKSKVEQTDKDSGKRKATLNKPHLNEDATSKNNKVSRGQPNRTSENNGNKDNRTLTAKPSLIPKLMKFANDNRNCRDQPREKTQTMGSLGGKIILGNNEHNASNENKKTKIQQPKGYLKHGKPITLHQELETDNATSNTISFRMTGLQERLKATTSMLRQKMEMDKSKDQEVFEETCSNGLVEVTTPNTGISNRRTLDDLYANISQLKDTVLYLSESGTFGGQRKYIEKLFISISEIKSITNKLCELENNQRKPETSDSNQHELNDVVDNISDEIILDSNDRMKKSYVNPKDNKIHITISTHDSKKKKSDLSRERSEEVQTELTLSPKLSDPLILSACLSSKIKDTDSMDGVFIPTYEPPINIEDDEETSALDITITFPEYKHLQSSEAESHLPVCVSDISAEALKKLKRCPKDFKLLMNFVEGKISFQSGAGPANNFSISPDLKFIENVDYKKSEVINIKPSTECLYSSQMIPVENLEKPRNSMILKSTDSELLFNVVNLPFLYRNPYTDDSIGHKSCITFRDDKLLSVAIIAGQFFKSMPQIPSLTNIFEDDLVGNFSKTDSGEKEEKSPESEEKD